jgi:carboxyl-terminal processing protease
MRSIKQFAGIITPCFFAILLFGFAMVPSAVQAESIEDEIGYLEDFSDVYHLINSKYVTRQTSKELIYSAISGMINDLDPYSDLLTRQELEKLELQSVGQYIGIGLMVQKNEGEFIVTQVFENSPAQKAEIKPGDIINRIDENLLENKKHGEIAALLAGKKGTRVTIEYMRSDSPGHLIIRSLERELIKANSVECNNSHENITIATVHQFLKHTARELMGCMSHNPGLPLIVDLRNNPGGLLISAVEVADLFVGLGDIVQVRNREDEIIERYVARSPAPDKLPLLLILINKYSASAAEILAGAVRDRKAGILIGERSFGKGVVQSVYPIGADLFVKITTAKYYTPSQVSFDGIGIDPDIKVEDSIDVKRYTEEDRVFQEALKLAAQAHGHP